MGVEWYQVDKKRWQKNDDGFDYRSYEKELRKRQKEHLKKVHDRGGSRRPCLHDGCESCHGTGVKLDGSRCAHFISCPCPRCTPYSMVCIISPMTVS